MRKTPEEKYLGRQIEQILNSVPLVWRAKRELKKTLRKMDEEQSVPLIIELRKAASGLAAIIDVIQRSQNL